MSLVVVAAACSTATRAQHTGASPAGPSASGTPAAATPSVTAAPSEQSAADDARPRVLAGDAPRAAGVEVSVSRLRTSRPGGRVTGLSADGVAVGTEGRRGAAASASD